MQDINRRQFLAWGAAVMGGWTLGNVPGKHARPPAPFAVTVPGFMIGAIHQSSLAYLNTIIPALYNAYRGSVLPMLAALPAFVVVDTRNEALVNYGGELVAPEILGSDALTLFQVQYLLTTTRFGSVATPHRGEDPAAFGRLVYLKQHPRTGYLTPEHLLLEELIHVQQDITVMRHIIEHDSLDPIHCLHSQLKGISELAAHTITDAMSGDADYVFVLDDETHCETAADGVARLAARVGADEVTMLRALLYDAPAYSRLDAQAMANEGRHIWEMVTTWRHARDENGDAVGIAPAFMPYDSAAIPPAAGG